jgi:glycosyltransferase involved in cell wall biosynthesis
MPKVSVVIPTYNYGRFLGEAIQSVLDQTFQDFEIFVVDDGSTDNTKEVVDSFKDLRIKYTYQENRGLPAARNTGIKASSSEYIAFLDSDDVLVENALEKGVQVLDRHSDVGFSYGRDYLMDETGRVLGLRKQRHKYSYVREGREEIKEFLLHGNYVCASTVMARRRCLYDVGLFDPTFRPGSEDFDLWVRLAKRYAVACIAEPLVKYRIHPGSIGATRKLDEIEKKHCLILQGVFNDADVGPVLSSQRPKAYFHLYFRLADYAYGRGEMKTARKYLFRALKMHPKGFSRSLWLPWSFQFGKTWLPIPILDLSRQAKLSLLMVMHSCSRNSKIPARHTQYKHKMPSS